MQPDQGQTYWQPDPSNMAAPEGGEHDSYMETGQPRQQSVDEPLVWQASEYVQHEKQAPWYLALIAITGVLFLISVFLIKSWSFAALVVVLGIAVGVMAGRPPQIIRYSLSSHGLQVNEKTFSYHDFRAFGVLQDGPIHSIVLMPIKRFMPSVNVYFPLEQGEEIVDTFAAFLPMEPVAHDLVDRLARKLRF